MSKLMSRVGAVIGLCRAPSKKVVVLVDGDGVSSHHVEVVLDYLRERKAVSQVRVFGNINNRNVTSWSRLTKRQGLIVRHMPRLAEGKNGADIAMQRTLWSCS